jgi:hypothetical protein
MFCCCAAEQTMLDCFMTTLRHGHAYAGKISPEYNAWLAMRARCRHPGNPNFKNYGARGITVCERWEIFENFFADMGSRPSPKHSLDRIDNDGNYEPSNCRWATPKEQMNNVRGRKLTLQQAAAILLDPRNPTAVGRDYGISRTLVHRIKIGKCWRERLQP